MINIASRLVFLRKEHRLTQSEVAEHLGVTKASVSKWETGQTLPDIALLPLIASFYGVTLDELMDYEPMLTTRQIRARYEAYTTAFTEKGFDKVYNDIRADVRRYYSCYPFLQAVTIFLLNHCPPAAAGILSPDTVNEVHGLMDSLCRRVEENSPDPLLKENAYSLRMYLTLQEGRFDEVIGELSDRMLPDRISDMESLLITAYTASGRIPEADRAAQITIYRGVLTLLQNTLHRMQLQAGDAEALAENIKRAEAMIEAYDLLHLHPNTAAAFYYQAALLWLGTGGTDPDEALQSRVLRYLELFAKASLQLFRDDLQIHGDRYFSCITEWFSENRMGSTPVRNKKEVLQTVLVGFDHPALQVLGAEKLMAMKEQLRRDCEAYM